MSCPPHHVEYPSEYVAGNAARLHEMCYPGCGGYNTWPCGDHWHVGHPTIAAKTACLKGPSLGHRRSSRV